MADGQAPYDRRMERVTGIGGVFFRANDPRALSRWYAEHLGVNEVPTSYGGPVWEQEAGPTVFAPFPADSDHVRRLEQQRAVNFRVRDLDAMVEELRGADIEVEVHDTVYPNGRFAELVDPEGTPIQLWEPAVPATE
jgi:predicted enzyme related to lactoylglutathione lyase